MLDKIAKNIENFCSIGNNFKFKVRIYYEKCRKVRLPQNAHIYGTSIILSGQALTNFSANCGNTFTSD